MDSMLTLLGITKHTDLARCLREHVEQVLISKSASVVSSVQVAPYHELKRVNLRSFVDNQTCYRDVLVNSNIMQGRIEEH